MATKRRKTTKKPARKSTRKPVTKRTVRKFGKHSVVSICRWLGLLRYDCFEARRVIRLACPAFKPDEFARAYLEGTKCKGKIAYLNPVEANALGINVAASAPVTPSMITTAPAKTSPGWQADDVGRFLDLCSVEERLHYRQEEFLAAAWQQTQARV